MQIQVTIEQVGENWCAYAPDLDDVIVATGQSRDEAISKFRDALHGLWDFKRGEGSPVPPVTELELHEVIAA